MLPSFILKTFQAKSYFEKYQQNYYANCKSVSVHISNGTLFQTKGMYDVSEGRSDFSGKTKERLRVASYRKRRGFEAKQRCEINPKRRVPDSNQGIFCNENTKQ
jgi:hypothetical protein